MSRGPDAGTLLARALKAGGPGVRVIHRDSTRWASATFSGARHAMTLEAPETFRLDRWIATLPEAAFDLHGHLVADLDVTGVRLDDGVATIEIEALTIES